MILNITCVYCGRRLDQPTVRHHNRNYHLDCYIKKDDSRIFTKPVLDNLIRRLEFMGEICDNALDNKSSFEERHRKYQEIRTKYADIATGTPIEA